MLSCIHNENVSPNLNSGSHDKQFAFLLKLMLRVCSVHYVTKQYTGMSYAHMMSFLSPNIISIHFLICVLLDQQQHQSESRNWLGPLRESLLSQQSLGVWHTSWTLLQVGRLAVTYIIDAINAATKTRRKKHVECLRCYDLLRCWNDFFELGDGRKMTCFYIISKRFRKMVMSGGW